MSQQNPEKKEIEDATVNELFAVLSAEFGYDYSDWLDEIVALQELWQTQGYVEVYESKSHRQYGRIKDSSLKEGASPWYIGIYHARLLPNDEENDPLVVVKFHKTETGEIVDMKLMLDHNEIFGDKTDKYDPNTMKRIRMQIDTFVQQADAKLNEEKPAD
ncbi:hypothetical protein [Pseudoalteromonas sp. Z9A6]|uniref:hypothetical protein n=1 Tax=Pseudoalteromonas sp. Z9A6 TaxID=2686352 RepID=UPI0013FE3A1A|nr:hypothetical protein [Pseudoalteromonas sp. Z9A6]